MSNIKKDYYVAYFDGACEPTNPGGNMGVGAFILDMSRECVFKYSEYISKGDKDGRTSNNIAEYIGVIRVLEYFISKGLENEKIICCGDSKLVVNQMNGQWNCNGGLYDIYYIQAKTLRRKFKDIRFIWIPREKNGTADKLSKQEMIKNKCEFRIQKL